MYSWISKYDSNLTAQIEAQENGYVFVRHNSYGNEFTQWYKVTTFRALFRAVA